MDTHTVGVLGVAVEGKFMGYLVVRREREKERRGRERERERKEKGERRREKGCGEQHQRQQNARHRGTPTTSTCPCPRFPPNPRAGKSLSLQTKGTQLFSPFSHTS